MMESPGGISEVAVAKYKAENNVSAGATYVEQTSGTKPKRLCGVEC